MELLAYFSVELYVEAANISNEILLGSPIYLLKDSYALNSKQ